MPRRWQYPSWASNDPEGMTRPEVTTPDKWWQAFSEPVRQHAGKLAFAAIIASGVAAVDSDLLTQPEATSIDKWYRPLGGMGVEKGLRLSGPTSLPVPEVTETITLDKWFSPLVEPVRTHKLVNVSFGEFRAELELAVPEEFTLDKWYTNLSIPTLPKPRVAEFPSFSTDVEALTQPETTSPDKWWRPLEEPVRQQPISHAALYASGLVYIGAPSDVEPLAERLGWYTTLAEPTLPKPRVAEFPSFTTDAESLTQGEDITLDKWYVPFSEYLHKDARSEAALLSGNNYEGEATDFEPTAEFLGWYRPLEQYLYSDKRTDAALYPHFTTDPEALTQPEETTLDRWWRPLSEFQHDRKRSTAALKPASVIDAEQLTLPEETLVSKWVPQTSEPVRLKPRLLTALQQAFFVDANIAAIPPAEDITLDKWYHPLEQPVLVKGRASEFPTFTVDTEGLTLPEVTSLDKWWRELSEPVRVKPRLLTALQEAFFIDANIAAIPPAEVITLDKYWQPLAEPVRVKARASEFPTHTIDVEALTQPETATLDKWFAALSEPVRVEKRSLAALLAGGIFQGDPTDTVEPLPEFMDWYKSLDEPVLPRVLPVASYPASFPQYELVEIDPVAERLAWYVELSTPTLPKVRVAEFPAFITDAESLTRPEVAKLDHWWRELSEPVHTQPRSLAALISGEVQIGELVDVDPVAEQLGWYRDLDLPTLPKPRVAEFLAFVIDGEALTLPESATLDKWWQELSEPVRVKARLHEALQLHVTTDITFDIAEIITLDKWYTPLAEPIRLGDRLIVPFRLPASVGREYQTATLIIKGKISKEADQTHVSKEADQTHISKEADQTKDSKRC